MSNHWSFVLTNKSGSAIGELVAAQNRKVDFWLDKSAEASFEMNAAGLLAETVGELTHDLVVYRNGVKLFRGRIDSVQDSAEDGRHTISVHAASYRSLLNHRILWSDLSYTTTEQEQIGWNLINHSQTQTGGSLGITRGTGQTTGVTRTRNYFTGQNVGELIGQLSEVINGFDWDITEGLVYKVYYPERGSDTAFILDYGGVVSGFTVSSDAANFANAIRVTGDAALTDQTETDAGIATAPEGRFEMQLGFPSITVQSTLNERSDYLIDYHKTRKQAYVVKMRPNTWPGTDDCWLGDTVRVVIKSGRLNVNEQTRVQGISFDLSDAGAELTTLTLGHRIRNILDDLSKQDKRLTDLERE